MSKEVPKTDHDAIIQMWTVLIGVNGSGLVKKFECVEQDMEEIMAKVIAIERDQKRRKAAWLTLDRLILACVAVITGLSALGVF